MGSAIASLVYGIGSALAAKVAGDGWGWFRVRRQRRRRALEAEINKGVEKALAAKKKEAEKRLKPQKRKQ
jgi:NAD(P)-dependent dehydrogenase (short-subunit alcohol dehydrogenase family)